MKELSATRKAELIETLRELVKPTSTVYTSLLHVSRSGMYRVIRLYVVHKGEIADITGMASDLLEGWDDRHQGARAHGCGMDMGFHLVYNLGYVLYGPGWRCNGRAEHPNICPSTEHSHRWNPDTSKSDIAGKPYRRGIVHHDGGYSLRHVWR